MEAGIAISCEMQGLVGVQLRMVLKHNAEKNSTYADHFKYASLRHAMG